MQEGEPEMFVEFYSVILIFKQDPEMAILSSRIFSEEYYEECLYVSARDTTSRAKLMTKCCLQGVRLKPLPTCWALRIGTKRLRIQVQWLTLRTRRLG